MQVSRLQPVSDSCPGETTKAETDFPMKIGPVGNGMQLETAAQLSAVWSYTKSKGLYGGVQLDGTILSERSEENG